MTATNKNYIKIEEANDSVSIGSDKVLDLVKIRQVLELYRKRGSELIADPKAEDALYAMLIIKRDIAKLLKLAGEKLVEEGISKMGDDFNGADGKKVQVAYLAKADFECDDLNDVDPRFVRESLNKTEIRKYVAENGTTPKGVTYAQSHKKLQLKLI